MKRLLLVILSIIFSLVSICTNVFAETEYEEVTTDIPPKMLFLGDSIATGFGLEGYNNGRENCNSYANKLANEYDKELNGLCETSMENLAIDGQTSGELLEDLKNGVYDKNLKDADAIILSIGGNDLLAVIWDFIANELDIDFKDSTPEDQQNNFSEIIQSITSLDSKINNNLSEFDFNFSQIAKNIKEKSDGVLVVQTLYNPFDQLELEQIREFIAKKIKTLNSYIESHKNDEGAQYIVADVYSEFYGKGNELTRINSMDIHPNQEGHNVISQCINKTIRTERYTYLTEKVAEQTAHTGNVSQDSTNKYIVWIAVGLVSVAVIALVFIIKKIRKREL